MGTAQAVLSKCQHCKEHGTDFCYDCREVLCATCRTDHDKYTRVDKHVVVQLKFVNQQILKTKLNCDKHDRKFEHLCLTCDTLVCSDCLTAPHAKHDFCDLSTTVKKAEEDLNVTQAKLQEKRQILSTVIKKIKSDLIPNLKRKIEAIRLDLNKHSSTLHAVIDNVKIATEDCNAECFSIEEDRLNTTTKNVERLCYMYDSAIDKIKRALLEKHPVGFFTGYRHVIQDVHSLDEIIDTVEDGHIQAFESTEFTHKVINSMLLNLNESKLQDRDDTITKLKKKEERTKKDIKRMQQQIKEAEAEHEKTIQEMQQLSSELQGRDDKIRKLVEQEEILRRTVKSLQNEGTAYKETIMELKQKSDQLEWKLKDQDSCIRKWKEQVDKLTKH